MIDSMIAAESASVVVVGRFNPAIFSPAWLLRHRLISSGEADEARVNVIMPQAAIFETAWLRCQVTDDRLELLTRDPQEFDRLRDAAMGILTILHHTPIAMMGLNRDAHYAMKSFEEWHAIGDSLVPKEGWEPVLNLPGMRTVIVEGVRPDEFVGSVQVRVQPSDIKVPGIFIGHNDHYVLARTEAQPQTRDDFADERFRRPLSLEPSSDNIDTAVHILQNRWHDSLARGEALARPILRAGKPGGG